MNTNKALINSYSRLVNQEKKTIEEVPEEYREAVAAIVATMPKYVPSEDEQALMNGDVEE